MSNNNNMIGFPGGGRGGQMTININDLDQLKCDSCGGTLFTQGLNVRLCPAIVSPTGQPSYAHYPVGFVCISCGRNYGIEEMAQLAAAPKNFPDSIVDTKKEILS